MWDVHSSHWIVLTTDSYRHHSNDHRICTIYHTQRNIQNGTYNSFLDCCRLGTGLLFTPSLLAMQAHVKQEDTATATSTMGFVRNLSACLSVIIGGTVLQNGMAGRSQEFLEAGLSRNLTMALTGDNAAANVNLVREITDQTKQMVVREVFAASLRFEVHLIICACMVGAATLCGSWSTVRS
jgi:hypothetical protein